MPGQACQNGATFMRTAIGAASTIGAGDASLLWLCV